MLLAVVLAVAAVIISIGLVLLIAVLRIRGYHAAMEKAHRAAEFSHQTRHMLYIRHLMRESEAHLARHGIQGPPRELPPLPDPAAHHKSDL